MGENEERGSLDRATTGPHESRLKRLLILTDRKILTGLLLLVALALLVGLGVLGGLELVNRDPLLYVFSALTGGNFTLITIIVSINQLVVSRQLSTPGELRTQIQETNEYRESVIEALPGDDVAPVTPTEFLHLLFRTTREALGRLEYQSEELDDEEARALIDDLVADLTEHIDYVDDLLQASDRGIFSALSATLTTNYSQHIYRARELQHEHADALSETDNEALDELVVLLQQIDVARQYLKTLYMQDELSQLSQWLLVVGIPAVFVSVAMLKLFSTTVLDSGTIALVTPLAVTLSMAPLAVVFSFVVRISAVARRTVAITPFTTASQEM